MKRSIVISMLALILSCGVVQAGQNQDYLAADASADNIGHVLSYDDYQYSTLTAEEVQAQQAGRYSDVLFVAICGSHHESDTTTTEALICTFSTLNQGSKSFTLSREDVALVDDLGIRTSSIDPIILGDARFLDEERVPPGQGVDKMLVFEYTTPATYPMRIEVYPLDWDEPVVLLIEHELPPYPTK